MDHLFATARRIVIGALFLGVATSSLAQFTGFVALPDCSDVASTSGAELIATYRSPTATIPTGFLFDLSSKGGASTEGTRLLQGSYESRGNWRVAQQYPDVVFDRVTLPPSVPGGPARVALDSGDLSSVDMGSVAPLEIGNSLPVGVDAGIGLVMDSPSYAVQVGSQRRTFPERDSDGSITIAFAPLADVDPRESPAGCSVSGPLNDPWYPPGTVGSIVGYAIYRIAIPASGIVTPDDFVAAITDGDPTTGFQDFVHLWTFTLDQPADVSVDTTTNDRDLTDGAILHNPDGRWTSGDEIILWTDRAVGPRAHPERAPLPGIRYAYAIQPAATGDIDRLETCFTVNCVIDGDHLRDLDGDGQVDAVDLDSTDPADLAVEFYSPQSQASEGGYDGLGLTWQSKPALSAMVTVPETPIALRRSLATTDLDPITPPLASSLPLTIADDYLVPFTSGDVDPDPSVLAPSMHPLVFYAVPGHDVHLALSGTGASQRIRFTS